jgi:Ca2+-binding RTX toxin-like protein
MFKTCACALCQGGFQAEALLEAGEPQTPLGEFSASGTWRWGSSDYGSTGGVVTYSFAGAGLTGPTGFFRGLSVDMAAHITSFDAKASIRAALAAWEAVLDIRFAEIADEGGNLGTGMMADIRIAMGGGLGANVLGKAYYAPYFGNSGRVAVSGDVVVTSDENWDERRFYLVALHEIGHALGLDHSFGVTAVMNASVNAALFGTGPTGTGLQQDDIDGGRILYGAGPFSGALTYRLPEGQGRMTLLGAVPGLAVTGNELANALAGSHAAESFDGAAGDDTLRGGHGADTLTGGAGYDIASYIGSAAPVSVSLTHDGGWSGDATGDVLASIESLIGSSLADFLQGSEDHNIIEGGAGGDTIDGRAGNDWISFETAGAAFAVNLDEGTGWAGDATDDSIMGVENIRGSRFADYLFGDWQANILRGDEGGDVLYGAANSDTIYYSTSPAPVRVDLSTNSATGGHAQGDTLVSVENVFATPYNDTLIGDSASNTLVGWFGADIMTGHGGNDIFRWTSMSDSDINARDRVTDFHRAHGDLLDFSAIDADTYFDDAPGDQPFAFTGTDSGSGRGEIRYLHEGGNTIVVVTPAFGRAMHIQLDGIITLEAQDFVL